jgi:hypothetical protein
MKEHSLTPCQLTAEGHQSDSGQVSVRPASIIAFADVFKHLRAYMHTYPMVEEGKLVPGGTPGSDEIMGEPHNPCIWSLTVLIQAYQRF